MYTFQDFPKKLCSIFRQHFDLLDEECSDDIYSIWHFRPENRWMDLKNIFMENPLFRAQWFPLLYWMVLAIMACGTVYSFREFYGLYYGRGKVSTWRQRKYMVLPPKFLKKSRVVGAFVMLSAWLLLWYAIVTVSPTYMTPWLTISAFVLALDVITWILEVMAGNTTIDVYTVLSFILQIANYISVQFMRNIFLLAVEKHEEYYLRLWPINK